MKQMITIESIAVDTNVLMYMHDEYETPKKLRALAIVAQNPVIASQVVSEYLNVLRRITKKPKQQLIEHACVLVENCLVVPSDRNALEKARDLIARYDFQLFDALIMASALQAGCTVLYSEDLQHNQWIEGKLRIVNPFL